MSEVAIRAAGPDDLPVVADLWRRLDNFHRGLGLAFPEPDDPGAAWLASFERTLGRFSFLWLAEQDGVPQAFLLARYKRTPDYLGGVFVGEISDLYVDESLRGAGVGARLVEAALAKLKELGVHSIEVQVLADNQIGLDFWYKQGFQDELTQVRLLVEE